MPGGSTSLIRPTGFFWRIQARAGNDIQVRVSWLSGSSEFKMQVTDTTTHQMTQVAKYPLSPTDQLDLTTADYIVERPTTKDNDFLHQLRNFFTWNVKSAQAAAYGGSLEGLHHYPWTRLNIYDKSSNDQLESTYPPGQRWLQCGLGGLRLKSLRLWWVRA